MPRLPFSHVAALLSLGLATLAGGCSLVGGGCPTATFGLECELIGEWALVSVSGERASGTLEVDRFTAGFLSLPNADPECSTVRGAYTGSASLDDDEGEPRPFQIRLWQARWTCPNPSDPERPASFSAVTDFATQATLAGDELTLAARVVDGDAPPIAGLTAGRMTLLFERE